MAKSNPLFVDSTVLHGDRISTQIELTDIILYDEETVSLILTNHLREVQNIPLKISDEGNYHARVWLSHQKAITYRFLIEKDGAVVFQSPLFESRAQYALIEKWRPEDPNAPVKPKKVESHPVIAAAPENRIVPDGTRQFASIMEKWGF